MSKYKVTIYFPDGTNDEQDEVFDTEKEAKEYGCQLCSDYLYGMKILNMSNPWENPLEEGYEDVYFEVDEVDE